MQALGQVFLDLDQGPRNRALEALDSCRTMAFHHNALLPQEARAIMPSRRQISLQASHQGQREGTHHT